VGSPVPPLADAAEEPLERVVDAEHDILQDLGVDLSVFGQSLLDAGQLSPLLLVGDGDAPHAPRFAPLANGGVVDMATEYQDMPKFTLLLESRLESVLIGFCGRSAVPNATILSDGCNKRTHRDVPGPGFRIRQGWGPLGFHPHV
jgi:hypothetical protein